MKNQMNYKKNLNYPNKNKKQKKKKNIFKIFWKHLNFKRKNQQINLS